MPVPGLWELNSANNPKIKQIGLGLPILMKLLNIQFSSVQSLSRVRLFLTP